MKYKKYFLIVVLAVLAVGCSDEFLETEPTEFISSDKMSELSTSTNPEIFDGTINGLYSLMYQTGTGGTDLDHDDFGQKSYDIYSDLLSGDMALSGYNYGWYRDVAKLVSTLDNTSNDNYKPWRYYYRIIRGANAIIDDYGGSDATPEGDDAKWQMGQAKVMRAYSYFYLANLFADDYDPNAKILPLYTSIDQESLPLSSASEVWNLIKSDLEDATGLLADFPRKAKHEVNVDVANGFLAYTYLTLDEYEQAIATADKVIGEYDIVPFDKVSRGGYKYANDTIVEESNIARNAFSYIDGEGADWIWGMDITMDQGLDLVSFWGQVDLFTYSYAWAGDPKTMDAGLYNSIPSGDERKDQFVNFGVYYPLNKFYYEDGLPNDGDTYGAQREITADYVYMRVEEMHLIKAEAQAFSGDEEGARSTLKGFLSERIGPTFKENPDNPEELIVDKTAEENLAYIDDLSGQDLKDEIYKQWRIEMWGEGKSYLALKRFEKDVYRQGHIDYNETAIPYNDDRLTLEIPYQEIQDNPNITQ